MAPITTTHFSIKSIHQLKNDNQVMTMTRLCSQLVNVTICDWNNFTLIFLGLTQYILGFRPKLQM